LNHPPGKMRRVRAEVTGIRVSPADAGQNRLSSGWRTAVICTLARGPVFGAKLTMPKYEYLARKFKNGAGGPFERAKTLWNIPGFHSRWFHHSRRFRQSNRCPRQCKPLHPRRCHRAYLLFYSGAIAGRAYNLFTEDLEKEDAAERIVTEAARDCPGNGTTASQPAGG